ncbi:MAG: T9SS type A sorting domain-containing protein, partial [Candidatus Eisenbacteria bacterium]|nr:T9SS type A sorting domain-containing protein [Candidatus Eisenbacteria bacterium]
NAPNPFGAETMIRVDLPQPRHVELTIYDIQGRSVATILDEEMIAGTHEVAWDGRGGGGEPLASGIYFCILRTEGYRQAIRMMLAH